MLPQEQYKLLRLPLHDIGETIMVTGGPILKDFADGLRDVTQHFNALDDGTKKQSLLQVVWRLLLVLF